VLKWVIKTIFINSSPFPLLIINVKILSNLKKEWCTFGRKKRCFLKKTVYSQGLNVSNMQKRFWFLSNFEHVNFAINEKYSKKQYDNPKYYASFVIFHTYKNIVLRSVHSLEWLLWLWFYPYWYCYWGLKDGHREEGMEDNNDEKITMVQKSKGSQLTRRHMCCHS